MIRRLLTVFAAIALAAFALAACGDDDESAEAPASTDTPAETTDAAESGGGATLEVVADPGGQLAYTTGDLSTSPGEVTLEFVNESATPHDVLVSGDSGTIGGTDVISGDTTTATVELEAGDYTYFCSVSGHQEAGMEGALTVE